MARKEFSPGMHFLHIGKTGGTSLKKLVKQQQIEETGSGLKLLMHSHSVRLPDVLAGYRRNRAAFFLRDPLTRFVSGFNSRLREGAPIAHIPLKPAEKVAFSYFSTPNELAETLSARNSFRQDRAFLAMHAMIHTRLHYTYWLRDLEYVRSRLSHILFIGLQEHYSEDVRRFFYAIGVDLAADVPHFHRAPPEAAPEVTELSTLAQRNLRQWYAADVVIHRWAMANRDRWSYAGAIDPVGISGTHETASAREDTSLPGSDARGAGMAAGSGELATPPPVVPSV